MINHKFLILNISFVKYTQGIMLVYFIPLLSEKYVVGFPIFMRGREFDPGLLQSFG